MWTCRCILSITWGNLTLRLVFHLPSLPSLCQLRVAQAKKDVAQVFNNILRRQIGTRSPTVEYICTKKEILFTLVRG